MGRAAGRSRARRPPAAPAPGSPEGRELGLDDRVIPSGIPHLVQQQTVPAPPAVPEAPPIFRGDMQHGVPAGPDDNFVRPADKITPGHEARRHGSQPARHQLPPPEPDPLPVYIVEHRSKIPKRREAITRAVTVAAAGGEPTRICSEDHERVEVRVFNEAAAAGNVIRLGNTQASVAGVTATAPGDGIAVEPQTWTPPVKTQGELWAVSQAATVTPASVLIVTEVND